METIRALVAADVTKLALLSVILGLIVVALPRVVQLVRAWRESTPPPTQDGGDVRKLIDERAQHKANSAIAPLAARLSDIEENMDKRDAEVRRLSDQAIATDLKLKYMSEKLDDVKGGVDRIEDRFDKQSGRLNDVLDRMERRQS